MKFDSICTFIAGILHLLTGIIFFEYLKSLLVFFIMVVVGINLMSIAIHMQFYAKINQKLDELKKKNED